MTLTVFFLALCALLGIIILILMFVTWSLPLISPFSWSVFRVLFSMATVISILFMFSKEFKEWVEEVHAEFEGR